MVVNRRHLWRLSWTNGFRGPGRHTTRNDSHFQLFIALWFSRWFLTVVLTNDLIGRLEWTFRNSRVNQLKGPLRNVSKGWTADA